MSISPVSNKISCASQLIAQPQGWRLIAETIVKLALQGLIPLGIVWAAYCVVPLSFAAVALPVVAVASTIVTAILLFQPVKTPLPIGAPRGIVNQRNDCWIISLFLLLVRDERIKQWLLSPECPPQLHPFRDFVRSFDCAVQQKRPVVQADAKQLRACLGRLAPNLGRDSSTQQDITEGWMAFSQFLPPRLRSVLREKHHYEPALHQPDILPEEAARPWREEESTGHISLDIPKKRATLAILLNNFFDDRQHAATFRLRGTDRKVHEYPLVRTERNFAEAPPMLWIALKRFTASGRKIATPVDIPESFALRPQSGNAQRYLLDAFSVHKGATKEGGHYITFWRDANTGKWYEVDDDRVRMVGNDYLQSNRRKAYFFHYA